MRRITFWFDVISPYAFLAFEQLPRALQGLSVEVRYRPVLFAALLKHWGHKGPAEIEPKRAWTFRDVAWHARALGIALQTPAQHPFNPLPLLRLALACADFDGTPNRRVVQLLMQHVWQGGGADALDATRLQALREQLNPATDPEGATVKQALRQASEDATAAKLFGVPTFEVDGQLFWGVDALPMLAAFLRGDDFFAAGGAWEAAGASRPGVLRQ